MKEGLHTREDGTIFYHFHMDSGDRKAVKPFIDSMGDGRPFKYGGKRLDLVTLEVLEPASHVSNDSDHPTNEKAWNIIVKEVTRRAR